MTRFTYLLLWVSASASGGCAALTNPVADGVPVNRLPAEVLARPKSELRSIPLTLLRQKPPEQYRLDRGDVLAIVADDVLNPPGLQQPPVRLPDEVGNTAAVGYPIPLNEDATINLPRLPSLNVRGKTLLEVEQIIREAIIKAELVKPAAVRVSVQLLQRRRYRITVVREDTQPVQGSAVAAAATIGLTKKGAGFNLNLPAYENDVLRALNATGGLPGFDAKNEVVILRGSENPASPNGSVVRIPLRIYPNEPLTLREEDVILNDGDVVRIDARDTEVYYTAGLVGGGQYVLPRDYDLDVIQAIAQVHGPLINGGFTQTAFVASSVNTGLGDPSPSLCTVLRRLPDGRQIPIRVNLNKAFRDSRERIIIKPGDVVILQERPGEALARYFSQALQVTTTVKLIQGLNPTSILTSINP